jgi:HK97 family phage portal protein
MGGVSALSTCRATFNSAMAVETAAGKMFSNGIMSTGLMSTERALSKEQRQAAEQILADRFSGALNAGRPMLLDNGTKWEQLSINPEDAQMLETRKFGIEQVCMIFGVPPHMIGHSEKSTSWGTGLEQQVLGFQKFSLRRRVKRIEMSVEKQLLTPADKQAGITIEFALEGLLRGDSTARAAFYKAGLNDGWLNINQVCGLENLPPVEGGDINRVQVQNVPLTEAGKITEVKPPKPPADPA